MEISRVLDHKLADPAGQQRDVPMDLLQPEGGLIEYFMNNPPYYDEPKIYGFAAVLRKPPEVEEYHKRLAPEISIGMSGGASLDKDRAMWKVIGESVERYSLFMTGRQTVSNTFRNLRKEGEKLLDPDLIYSDTGQDHLYPKQLENVDWSHGFDLSNGTSCLIPTQLIAVPFWNEANERIWRAPITTGAAAGSSLESTIASGIFEVIERDAFMVSWLRQLKISRIINFESHLINSDDRYSALLAQTLGYLSRYHLQPEFFMLPSDLPVPTIMCILKDKTGIGPRFTLGLDTDYSVPKAMLGALEESLQLRPWVRQVQNKGIKRLTAKNGFYDIYNLEQRANLWATNKGYRILEKWLNFSATVDFESITNSDQDLKIADLVNLIKQSGNNVYFIDLTEFCPPAVVSKGIRAGKIIIPGFQPLYLIEQYADFVLSRLNSAETRLKTISALANGALQKFPHPML